MTKNNPEVVLGHKVDGEFAAVLLRFNRDARAERLGELALHAQNFGRIQILLLAHAVKGDTPRDRLRVAHRKPLKRNLSKKHLLLLRPVGEHQEWPRVSLAYFTLRERVLHALRQEQQPDAVAHILAGLADLFRDLHVLKTKLSAQLVERLGPAIISYSVASPPSGFSTSRRVTVSGCITPYWRIERARSASFASSNSLRGWNGLGLILSTSTQKIALL